MVPKFTASTAIRASNHCIDPAQHGNTILGHVVVLIPLDVHLQQPCGIPTCLFECPGEVITFTLAGIQVDDHSFIW